MNRGAEIKKAGCFFCHNNCGLLVHVKNGRVVKTEGNKEHPISRGFICPRGKNAPQWLYHSDQLYYPLKRVGERGEGKWQKISYDQALDEIAEKLGQLKERYGAETLLVSEGTYRSGEFWARSRFLNLFGNPQNVIDPGTICVLNVYSLNLAMVGACNFTANIPRAKCVVLWGVNPKESMLTRWRIYSTRIRRKEMRIIAVDPRAGGAASYADINLRLRPGTDTALALGWINVIIKEGLYDTEFVETWTYGFQEVAERVKEYTPEVVAKITGLGRDEIIKSARMYATSRPACIERGVATDHIGLNSSSVEQARTILRAITGNIDVPGGNPITYPPLEIGGKRFIQDSELELTHKCPVEQRKKQIGSDRFRLMAWPGWELTAPYYEQHRGLPHPALHRLLVSAPLAFRQIISGEPYPIKAMISWASNPLIWAPNTKLVQRALMHPNLELSVVLEYWMTPSAQLADYVLPAASWLERPLCSSYEDFFNIVWTGERSVPPLGERHEDYQFFRELGIRLGQEEHWPWKDLEEVIKYRIGPLDISYEEFVDRGALLPDKRMGFQKYKSTGFATPTGKVELYSTILEKLGYDPLPYYEEPPESPIRTPDVFKDYPLILATGGRFMPMFHSEHRQLGIGLREKHPDPLLSIHPDTAQRLGINDGDWVYIETRRGRIKQRAHISRDIRPDVVNAEASWWFPEKSGALPSLSGAMESNTNLLTLDDPEMCDPITGAWCNRALLCKVYKVNR